MVAIVGGNGLGLINSTAATLGQRGQFGAAQLGRNGDNVYVNAATGNLVLQHQDEFLAAAGLGQSLIRTYNSQGQFNDDNGGNWRLSLSRSVGNLTGTLNAEKSTVSRVGGDGAITVFTYDRSTQTYRSSDGAGAYDSLSYDSAKAQWAWTSGSTRVTEIYDANNGGRLVGSRDLDGNSLNYAYNANGLLSQIDDSSGGSTVLKYSGNNLGEIETRFTNAQGVAVAQTRVRYEYDSANRLSRVSTDLTPEDNSIADGKTVWTRYSYDGDSKRVATIKHHDGAQLVIKYQQIGANWLVAKINDETGRSISYTYDQAKMTAQVNDSTGLMHNLSFDAAGQIKSMLQVDTSTGNKNYGDIEYDASGNVTAYTDANGNKTVYRYDVNGNCIYERDALGNVVERSFGGLNQLQTETKYVQPDPDAAGPALAGDAQTTRYVYDEKNHLRFIVSPENRVTEMRYDARGQRTSTITHAAVLDLTTAATLYDFNGNTNGVNNVLPAAITHTGSAMKLTMLNQSNPDYPGLYMNNRTLGTAWKYEVTLPNKPLLPESVINVGISGGTWGTPSNRRIRAAFSQYGVAIDSYIGSEAAGKILGPVKQGATYTVEIETEASGAAIMYVYEKGSERSSGYTGRAEFAPGTPLGFNAQTYCGPTIPAGGEYFALLDNVSITRPLQESELAAWANGLGADLKKQAVRTDTSYDARGLLARSTSYAKLDAAGNGISDGSQSTVQYVYDQTGQLLQTVDARNILTSYAYDGSGRLIATRLPGLPNSSTVHDDAAKLFRINGKAYIGTQTTVTLENGRSTVTINNSAGRPLSIQERDANGNVLSETQYGYDRSGRPRWASPVGGSRSYSFYDSLGRKRAEVDGDGSLTEYRYSNEGQLQQLIRYAKAVDISQIALGKGRAEEELTLADLPLTPGAKDEIEYRGYDAAGRLVKTIDAAGYLTETRYDGQSRIVATVRYATPVSASNPDSLPAPAGSPADRTTRLFYDKDGKLKGSLDADGYLVEHNYNAAGQLVETVSYATATNAAYRAGGTLGDLRPGGSAIREYKLYDGKGQLVGSIDGENYLTELSYNGNGQLSGKTRYQTTVGYQADIGKLRPGGASQGTTYDYNALNQLSQETGPDGTVTRYAYDADGNRIATTVAVATSDERSQLRRFDARGLLSAELSGEGAARLPLAKTLDEIEAVWTQYGTQYAYDALGRRRMMVDAAGNRTLYYYDRDGRLSHTINAAGEVEARSYNAQNRLERTTAYATRIDSARLQPLSGGNDSSILALVAGLAGSSDTVVRYEYDQRGLLASQTDAEGFVTRLHYDAFGQLDLRTTQIQDGRSVTDTLAYNRRGQLTDAVSDAGGANLAVHTDYDAFGRPEKRRDANGNVTSFGYDKLGRQVSVQLPLGPATTATYDAFDRVLTQTDANGQTTRTEYNTQERSLTLTTPEGVKKVVRNNRHGQQIELTDGNGNTTTFEYDRNGKLLKTVNALKEEVKNAYDQAGRLWQSTDANGTVTEFTYDAANRVLSKTIDPSGLKLGTSYTYDALGQVQTVTDPRGIVTRNVYDKKGQLTSVTVDDNGLKLETRFEYDGRGKTLRVSDPAGRVTIYEYDKLGRRTAEVADPKALNAQGLDLRTAYEYDGNGNIIGRTDANGNLTRFVYDANNRLSIQLDAAGALSRYEYDDAGRLILSRRYAHKLDLKDTIALPKPRSLTSDTIAFAKRAIIDPDRDLVQRNVYNKDGQIEYTVDGAGAVVRNKYDGNGNVVESDAFATRIGLSKLDRNSTPAQVQTLLDDAVKAASANNPDGTPAVDRTAGDRMQRMVYDAANRLVASAVAQRKLGDGKREWAISASEYDKAGNLTLLRNYSRPLLSATPPTQPELRAYTTAVARQDNSDGVKRQAYDAANRLVASATALGLDANGVMQWALAHQEFDRNGNLIRRTEYAQALPANRLPAKPDAAAYKTWLLGITTDNADRITRFGYDAANRLSISVDALGAITRQTFDGSGNVLQRKQYAKAAAPLPRNKLAEELLDPAQEDNAANRVERNEYDKANRLAFRLDAGGYIKEWRYDALGQAEHVYEYREPAALNIASITAATLGRTARHTGFSYDAQGKVSSITDALGNTEYYRYTALGQKSEFTNKAGTTWNYQYDAGGRLIFEMGPAIDDYSSSILDQNPDSPERKPVRTVLMTEMKYDALGNLTESTEASGTALARTTGYEYDAAGRQILTKLPPAFVFAADTGTLPTERKEALLDKLQIKVAYDTLGRAISSRDVNGNISYKVYNARGQLSYDIDAKGYVTEYVRNAFGDVTALTRHAEALPAGTLVEANAALRSADEVARQLGLSARKADNRTIVNRYDNLSRVVRSSEPLAWSYDPNSLGGNPYVLAARTTDSEYNAYGELVAQSVYGASGEAAVTKASTTRYYYNARGNRAAQVQVLNADAGNRQAYLTTYEYDSAGNLQLQSEYSNAIGSWDESGYGKAESDAASDRITRYTYDDNKNKTSESRIGALEALQAGGARRDVTISFDYNVLGNLRKVTDADRVDTYTYYDKLGRTIGIAKVAPQDKAGGKMPFTELRLDVHGNIVSRIEYANGSPASVNPDALPVVARDPARDRVTSTVYDINGRARQVFDAEGKVINYSYDRAGRLVYQWRQVSSHDGTVETAFQRTGYDELGQVVRIDQPGNTNLIKGGAAAPVTQVMELNGFGEVTQRTTSDGQGPNRVEKTRYDGAGRAWLSNADGGIYKVSLYDTQGRATASIQSASGDANALANLANAKAVLQLDQLVRTNTRYDALGHVVDRRQADDSRLMVLARNGLDWMQRPLNPGESLNDSLVLLGDGGDAGSRFSVHYRPSGSSSWIEATGDRVQWVAGYPVFSVRGLAPADYEYKVMVQPAGMPAYERTQGTLSLKADLAYNPAQEVVQLYLMLFDRAPEMSGLNFWLDFVNRGFQKANLLQGMLMSAEAQERFGGLSAFEIISKIYGTAFNQTPAELQQRTQEMTAWAHRYANAAKEQPDGRGQVLADLLTLVVAYQGPGGKAIKNRSKVLLEYRLAGGIDKVFERQLMALAVNDPASALVQVKQQTQLENNQLFVIRAYAALLGRAPEREGIDFWTNFMQQGMSPEEVARLLLESEEGQSPALYPPSGLTPQQYNQQLVERAYSRMLNRQPSAAELADWLKQLNGGLSKGLFGVKLIASVADYRGADAILLADRTLFTNKVSLAHTAGIVLNHTADGDASRELLANLTAAANTQEAAERAQLAIKADLETACLISSAAGPATAATPLEDIRRVLARMYIVFLGRTADLRGLNFYLARNPTTPEAWQQIAAGFLNSEDAHSSLPNWQTQSNSDFVKQLYTNGLGTIPDSDLVRKEMAAFVKELEFGIKREEVALRVALGMLASPQLRRADYPYKALLDNRTTISLLTAQSLNMEQAAAQKEVLKRVTATSMKEALEYAFKQSEAELNAKTEVARLAATGMLKHDSALSKAAEANYAAIQLLKEVKASALAARGLPLLQLYAAILGSGMDKPEDVASFAREFTEAGSGDLPALAQKLLSSTLGQQNFAPGLGNEAFVKRFLTMVLGSSDNAPAQYIAEWTAQAASVSRGTLVVNILSHLQGFTTAQPTAEERRLLNGRASFMQKVADAFSRFEQATAAAIPRMQDEQAQLKKAMDDLYTQLKGMTDPAAAEAERQRALDEATRALNSANTVGDGKALARLETLRMYVTLMARPNPRHGQPTLDEIKFWENTDPTARALGFIASAEGLEYFSNSDSKETFVRKLYARILNRSSVPQDEVDSHVAKFALYGGDARGRIAAEMLSAFVNYSDKKPAELEYKQTFDAKVQGMLSALKTEADRQYTNARNQEAAIAALYNQWQQAQRQANSSRDEADKAAPAASKGQYVVNNPSPRRDIVVLYAALRGRIDYDGLLTHMPLYAGYQPNPREGMAQRLLDADYGSLDNKAFVRQLYIKVVGRKTPPDEIKEVQWWLDRTLNQGWSRAQLALAMMEAGESRENYLPIADKLEAEVTATARGAIQNKATKDETARRDANAASEAQQRYANASPPQPSVAETSNRASSFAALLTAYDKVLIADQKFITAAQLRTSYDDVNQKWLAAKAKYENYPSATLTAYRNSVPANDLLRRTTQGLAKAADLVNKAAVSFAATSDEAAIQGITHLFIALLDRGPTLDELRDNLVSVKNGASLVSLANSLMTGKEAVSRNLYPQPLNKEAFIKQLYKFAFGRSLDNPEELPFWLKEMNTRSPAETALGIVQGAINLFNNDTTALTARTDTVLNALVTESTGANAVNNLLTQANQAARDKATQYDAVHIANLNASPDAQQIRLIAQLYLATLGRAPEAEGVRFWYALMHRNPDPMSAAQVAENMLNSPEGATFYPSSLGNQQFVTQLFERLLGRTPEKAELDLYTSQLGTKTRGQVVVNVLADVMASTSNELMAYASRTLLFDKTAMAMAQVLDQAGKHQASVLSALDLIGKALKTGVEPRVTSPQVNSVSVQVTGMRIGTSDNLYKVDRWGNVLSMTDLRNPGSKASYTYNGDNQVLTQSHYTINGQAAPLTATRYDAMGRVSQVTDARGFSNKFYYDANGNLAREEHADGGKVEYEVNQFGQRDKVRQYRAENVKIETSYSYDRLGRMLESRSGTVDIYYWNGYGKEISGAWGELVEKYAYDQLGRRIISSSSSTVNVGDPNQSITRTTRYDLGGNIIRTNDGAGQEVTYVYDGYNQKTVEANGRGQKTWEYDSAGRAILHTDLGKVETRYQYNASGQLTSAMLRRPGAGAEQDKGLRYTYESFSGRLSTIEDTDLQQTTSYAYDSAGNRVSEKLWLGTEKRFVQDQSLKYDSQGRLENIYSRVPNANYNVTYKYDAAGNRELVTTVYNPTLPTTRTIKVSYTYDAMNREKSVSSSVTTIAPPSPPGPGRNKAMESQYDMVDEGWQSHQADDFLNNSLSEHSYTYDWLGNRTGDGGETYEYDNIGRLSVLKSGGTVVGYRQYDSAGRIVKSLDQGDVRLNTYTKGGQLELQWVLSGSNNEIRQRIAYKYLGTGELDSYDLQDKDGKRLQTTRNVYAELRESALLTGTIVSNAGNSDMKFSWRSYDLNGNLVSVNVDKEARSFINDASGRILEKTETNPGRAALVTHTLIANGEVIGSSNLNLETFSGGHDSLSGESATTSNPVMYVVQKDGETARSIAKAVWGDERLWYKIAEANGIGIDDVLKAGRTLNIPAKATTLYNGDNTFDPYNAAEAVGNTTPELALPPPPSKGKKCGGVGQLIQIVIAVAVTVMTGGGAIGAVLGSIASQAAGIAMGIQDSFSWKAVGMAALSAGIGQGVGALAEGGLLGEVFKGTSWQAAAARAAVSNVATQGIANITGLQEGFSWRAIAASAAGAAVGNVLDEKLGLTVNGQRVAGMKFGDKLINSTISNFASGATAAIFRGGKATVAQIATDAFGNALGTSMVEAIRADAAQKAKLAWMDKKIDEVMRDSPTTNRYAAIGMGSLLRHNPMDEEAIWDEGGPQDMSRGWGTADRVSARQTTLAGEAERAEFGTAPVVRQEPEVENDVPVVVITGKRMPKPAVVYDENSVKDAIRLSMIPYLKGKKVDLKERSNTSDWRLNAGLTNGMVRLRSLDPAEVKKIRNSGTPIPGKSYTQTDFIQEQAGFYRERMGALKPEHIARNLDLLQGHVTRASQNRDVDASLLNAILVLESKGMQNAVSGSGALGGAQLTSWIYDKTSHWEAVNPFDASTAIDRQAQYLAMLSKAYKGNVDKMVAAYNQGEPDVNSAIKLYGSDWKGHIRLEGQNYIKSISAIMNGDRNIPGYFGTKR
ncbi:DUF4214 domain-containing protein [Massilia sp. NR 4-1]|uniref:DUF4214 domain-containing protein n=1 Tax=Massilia sp. NR 4-1 TaxID=1678028 RepID=UPI00067AD94D|nr:DUF4214 domain-containing protein [Massilia sp. NR 4-1]AKU20338.1 hypothetical protein ACZ75_01120 [Massilia sp. NR 4-1]